MEEENKQYPEGHFVGMWIGIGIGIFTGFGVAISIALNMSGFLGIGTAIGVSVGVAIGSSIEEKHKKEGRIRPLTEEEIKRRNNLVITGISILVLGVAVFLLLLFL